MWQARTFTDGEPKVSQGPHSTANLFENERETLGPSEARFFLRQPVSDRFLKAEAWPHLARKGELAMTQNCSKETTGSVVAHVSLTLPGLAEIGTLYRHFGRIQALIFT